MRNKIYKILIPVYFVLCLLVFVGIVYTSELFPILTDVGQQYVLATVLCVIGVVLGDIVHSFFHELAHYLAIKKEDGVVMEFAFSFLRFERHGDKFRVKFSFLPTYGGYVSFVSTEPERAGITLYLSVAWAWLATLVTSILFLVLFQFTHNFYLYCIFGGAFIAAIYALLVNFLSFMPSSDGYVLFKVKSNFQRIMSVMETQSRLYLGESLGEMNDELFCSENEFINGYYSYLRLLEQNNIETAENVLEKTIQLNSITYENQSIALLLEKFYMAVLKKDEKFIRDNLDEVLSYCDKEYNPTTLRIMIAYRKYTGETEWENSLKSAMDELGSNAFKGLLRTEKRIVDNLCKP